MLIKKKEEFSGGFFTRSSSFLTRKKNYRQKKTKTKLKSRFNNFCDFSDVFLKNRRKNAKK